MGIHGIYKEIGPGERIALSKLAVQTYESKGRPLRLAIDISIWLFQIQSSKGGSNPALRTFYYRLLRLISLSIHPLFVFDGPNKPPFKRNKRTGPNVASIPEFLAKQLLKQFGLPFHIAPGEAEAECALLQKEGIVDAVLSEDVDTLMFGSGLTLRSWSAEPGTGTKVTTHVNLYDAEKTRKGPSKLDRPGMILVAMMSGGDYTPEGIPGIGPKTACEAARAGFGQDLYNISRRNKEGLRVWKDRLQHELKTNESGFFKQKHAKQVIPEDFPRDDILYYYTHPVVSKKDGLDKLRQTLKWDQSIDVEALRTFCGEAFDWICVSGAKKFVRNLAPSLLVRELRLRHERKETGENDENSREKERKFVLDIHSARSHKSTDGTAELRVTFAPINLVDIDLDAEDPDPEEPDMNVDSDEEETIPAGEAEQEMLSPSKRRGPYLYDPTKHERIWMLEHFVKAGAPLAVQEWEAKSGAKAATKAAKAARQAERRIANQSRTARQKKDGGMQKGALYQFTRVTKPRVHEESGKPEESFPRTMTAGTSSNDAWLCDTEDPFTSIAPAKLPEQLGQPAQEAKASLQTSSGQRLAAALKAPPKMEFASSPHSEGPSETFTRPASKETCVSLLTSSPAAPPISPARDPTKGNDGIEKMARIDLMALPASVNTKRRRTPFRRVKTVGDHSEDPLDALDPLLSPTTRPENRSVVETLDLLASPSPLRVKQTTFSAAALPSNMRNALSQIELNKISQCGAKDPLTPSKRAKSQGKSKEEAIALSSSPGTPRNLRQKSITEWASPAKLRKQSSDGGPFPSGSNEHEAEGRKETCPPMMRMPPPLLLSSPPQQGLKRTVEKDQPPEAMSKGKQKRNIRVRESLEGTFAFADSPPVREMKRSKTLRVSQVGVLDLT